MKSAKCLFSSAFCWACIVILWMLLYVDDEEFSDGSQSRCVYSGLNKGNMTAVGHMPPEISFHEWEYLEDLFDLASDISEDCKYVKGKNNVLIARQNVTGMVGAEGVGNLPDCFWDVLKADMNEKFVLILVLDEYGLSESGWYCNMSGVFADPRVTHIFKQYYHPRVQRLYGHKLTYIPLGWGNNYYRGIEKNRMTFRRPSERKYTWAFYGNIRKSVRVDMWNAFKNISNGNWAHTYVGRPSHTNISMNRDVYENTIFCPCPMGWHAPASYRFTETLNAGCIPIVDTNGWFINFDEVGGYFQGFFNSSGFELHEAIVQVRSWKPKNKPLDFMHEWMQDMDKLDQMHASLMEWWMKYQKALRKKVKTEIQKIGC